MIVRNAVLACAALAAVGSTAVLVQELRLQRDAENQVAARIAGSWTLDGGLTRRLDGEARQGVPSKIKFEENENMLAKLKAPQPRFASKQIFSAGIVTIDGTKTHPYILTSDHGNMYLVYYNGAEPEVTTSSVVHTIALGFARNARNDVLFLAGDTRETSSLAFVHEGAAPVTSATTPASGPAPK
ncbi:MAG: hypothetical protein IPJ77_01260 [Planctomycetes bacterium]|nr:hypothetical protein [Planctomycetota bacterium]